VIIDDLDIVSVPFAPNEADTPPVIDLDAALSLSVATQGFQAISRRRDQVTQFRGAVQLPKLTAGIPLDRLKSPTQLPTVKPLGFRAPERLNHKSYSITYSV
jgi:hypothetical protein